MTSRLALFTKSAVTFGIVCPLTDFILKFLPLSSGFAKLVQFKLSTALTLNITSTIEQP